MKLAPLIFIATLALPVGAQAATAFASASAKDCVNAVVPNGTLRDQLFTASGLTFSAELAEAFASHRLGEKAAEAAAICLDDSCKGSKRKLADLYEAARPLADQQPLAPDGFTAQVAADAPAPATRPIAFLNGDWDWISLRCPAATLATTDGQTQTPAKKQGLDQPAWVIAKTEDDAGKAFNKRAFATFGYSSDRLTDKSTYDIDLFIGYARPILTDRAQLEFQPYLSFQRHSSKKVDDLALGAALTWYPGFNGDMVQLKSAWESDHKFKSSVWRADLGWTPPLFEGCARSTIPGERFATCELTLVGDYAEINDPGDKADLLTLKSFARLGANLNLAFGKSLGEDLGFVILTGGYQTRASVSGDDADADLATVSLGYAPGAASHFKVSIDYTNGRDLSSLEKEEKVVLTVGFRR
jgi:hypothetical protein